MAVLGDEVDDSVIGVGECECVVKGTCDEASGGSRGTDDDIEADGDCDLLASALSSSAADLLRNMSL